MKNQQANQLPLPWIEVSANWTIRDIGAPLLASLAEGLYDAQEVLREYVQNAVDSYVDFRRLTGRDPQNTVQVFIDSNGAEVHVMDRGVGMDQEDILLAKSIAVSPKLSRPNDFVGFRGIGIWSGLSVCDTLILETTKINVPYLYRLKIDFKSIRDHIYEPIPIDELLRGRFEIHQQDTILEDHYTHVRLINVRRDRYQALLDIDKMTHYAAQYLPVPYDPNWSYTPAIKKALATIPWTATYDFTINGEPIFRRFPSDAEIKEPEFVYLNLAEDENRSVAFAWVAETKRTGQRKAIEVNYKIGEVNNFAVRIKNFAVGNRGLYASPQDILDFDNLDWYVGEIYITDVDIKPDTNRRSFQRSFNSDDVIRAMKKFYTTVATSARGWSEEVNTLAICDNVQEIISNMENLLNQANVLDGNNLQLITKEWTSLKEYRDRLNKALNKANLSDTSEDSPRVLGERKYLRKLYVKQAIERSLGNIARIEELLQSNTATNTIQADESSKLNGNGKRKTSRARTARSKGDPITAKEALQTQAIAGNSTEITLEQTLLANNDPSGQLISLELAINAFLATVAAVVGEGSDYYLQIEERLPNELRRRGLDV
jgi:hypothetical protein